MVSAIGSASEGFPIFGGKDFLQSEVELFLVRLGDALNLYIQRGVMFRGVRVVLVIGVNCQYILPLLQMFDYFLLEDDGTVLRLVLPPDVGVYLLSV